MSRYINPFPQYPYAPSGQLFFYESEQNILKTTYADQQQTIANSNPVLLSAIGLTPNIFYSGSARVVLRTVEGQEFERDPVGGENSFADFGPWLDYIDYSTNDIVELTGNFYISTSEGNQGNDPSVTLGSNANWTLISFLGLYNSTTTYAVGNIVNTSDGYLWASQTSANLANSPSTNDGTNWLPAVNGAKIPEIISLNTWINKSASFTITAGKSYLIDGSGGAVSAALPAALVVGKVIIVHNESVSTNPVLITNPAFTIKGAKGTIAAGTDLLLAAGDTVHLVAKSTAILEVV
jgi:hypothetical protein